MRTRKNRSILLSLAVLVLISVSTASAAELSDSYALLIQQSPPDAGSVTPGAGIHKIQIGDTVALSAIPKAGYRFLYWLGDVSAADATSTTIQVDSPKLVVAVFTREAYEEELPGVQLINGSRSSGGSGGRLIGTPMFSPGAINPGSYFDAGDVVFNYEIVEPPEEEPQDEPTDEIPVPGETGDEVPEPATVVLLGLGATVFLRRTRK
jgi:hypothetical protein